MRIKRKTNSSMCWFCGWLGKCPAARGDRTACAGAFYALPLENISKWIKNGYFLRRTDLTYKEKRQRLRDMGLIFIYRAKKFYFPVTLKKEGNTLIVEQRKGTNETH